MLFTDWGSKKSGKWILDIYLWTECNSCLLFWVKISVISTINIFSTCYFMYYISTYIRGVFSAQFSGCSSTTNAHSETRQMVVCCQNPTLGALCSRCALSVLVGALFKKIGLFVNTPCILIHNYITIVSYIHITRSDIPVSSLAAMYTNCFYFNALRIS